MNFTKSDSYLKRALGVIPEQTMTFAKAAHIYPDHAPKYIESASGSKFIDLDGNQFIDYTMGLGTAVLGYNPPEVNKAVSEQLAKGNLYSLPSYHEVELAEKLVSLMPSAEKVRFYKNGADVCSIAVRLSRSFTGRKRVLFTGYHGHHEWYSYSLRDSGNLDETKQYSTKVNYNDLTGILNEFEQGDVAAIMVENAFEEPKEDFLNKLREACSEHNVILIFDEMWTGFRFPGLSYQSYCGVTPDVSLFSKGMASGFPISAIVGKSEILDQLEKIWGFTTFGSEALSMQAALTTIDEIEKSDAVSYIWKAGEGLIEQLRKLLKNHDLDSSISISGYPGRFKFDFLEADKVANQMNKIKEVCIEHGILWNNMFVLSNAHSKEDIEHTVQTFDKALAQLS